jgi:hypothetical protein
MDLINEVCCKIKPLAACHGFALSDADLYGCSVGGQFGRLEFHAMLPSGQLRLFGLYQLPAEQTFVAQLWSLDDAGSGNANIAPIPIASCRRVWTYDASTDSKALAREIVGIVTGWLEPYRSSHDSATSLS